MFGAAQAAEEAGDLDGFLARVEVRAFRMAQVALGHREDALDAVQDAMERMLGYRHRLPEEWPPLFWSVLRRRLTDHHRRATVQRRLLGWLVGSDGGEDGAEDPLDALPDPAPIPPAPSTTSGRCGGCPAPCGICRPASARRSCCGSCRAWTWPTPPAPWDAAKDR